MELWHGNLPEFVESSQDGSLVPQMTRSFARIHSSTPSPAEARSWDLSLAAMSNVAEGQGDDVGVSVEYHLPLSGQRIDVVFTGYDAGGHANALVVELKHWDGVSLEDKYTQNVIVGDAEHLHPSQQAAGYVDFLGDIHGAFADERLRGYPCAFCHELDASGGEVLRDRRFSELLKLSPLFQKGEEDALADYLHARVGRGDGMDVLDAFRKGRFKPSRKVIDCLADVIQRDERWHLLERQQLAYNAILAQVQRAVDLQKRAAVLVRGGPGTGKTVIAVQLLADVLRRRFTAAHSTGGRAFTTAMRATFKGADKLFIWNLNTRNAPFQGLDLLLVDEAHRIRENSDTRFTRARDRNRKSQVDELLDAAKVVVFLLDEHQYVRPDEVGRSDLIRDASSAMRIPLREYDLATQFRCGGCVEYVQWVDHLLGFRPTPPERGWRSRFTFSILRDPEELDELLEQAESGRRSARLLAGFGWKWSDPLRDGGLVDDIRIGSWSRPWNPKRDPKRNYNPENDPYTIWATTDSGREQVGCIYSAQGFEFDCVGVIWPPDLVWRNHGWVAQKDKSFDRPVKASLHMQRLVRNAYRVLLTRGLQEAKLLCLDAETTAHIAALLKEAR
ncbi:MAG TPA: DUF2075 domain-containing protein [Vicinamibacterales bacterium]|nr:DUF2075 domain-containing protein [Vicinamibacterales bacterium]